MISKFSVPSKIFHNIFLLTFFLVSAQFAWSAEVCAPIDTSNPRASLQFLDLDDSGIKCVKTTVGQLPDWIKENVIPEVNQAPRNILGRIKKFVKNLHVFHRPKKRVPCVRPNHPDSGRFFDRNAAFSSDIQNLLKDRAYQFLEIEDLWINYEGEIVPINQHVQQMKEKGNTKGKAVKTIAGKAASAVMSGLKVALPPSDDSKLLRLAVMGANKAIQSASVRSKSKLNFKSLLPDNSFRVQAIRGIDGVISLVIGAASLGLAPVSWGLSHGVLGIIREGTAIAATLASNWWSGSRSRSVLFDKKLDRPTVPNLTMPINLVVKNAASAVRSYLKVKSFHFLPFSRDLLKFMPVVGGVLGIIHGLKSIYQGVFGYEKGYEILRAYEKVYQKIFFENIEMREDSVKSVLGQGKGLLAHRKRAELNPGTLAEISCGCKMLDWLKKMKLLGKKKYDARINHIDRKLRWRESRLHPKNWFRKKENLEKYNREMSQYADEATQENVNLRSEIRAIDPGAEEILNIQIDPNNNYLAERQLSYLPPELKEANQKRQELDRKIAATVSNTYVISTRLWNHVLESHPDSDAEIVVNFPDEEYPANVDSPEVFDDDLGAIAVQ